MSRFRDSGGDRKLRSTLGSGRGVCVSCGTQQSLAPQAWSRATRPLCKKCGGLLEPTNAWQERTPELSVKPVEHSKRLCCFCPTVLRSSNVYGYCSACAAKARAIDRHFHPAPVRGIRVKSMVLDGHAWHFEGEIQLWCDPYKPAKFSVPLADESE